VNKIFRVASKFVRVKKNRKSIFRSQRKDKTKFISAFRARERRGREKKPSRIVPGFAGALHAFA
jgi:hypothetical protein